MSDSTFSNRRHSPSPSPPKAAADDKVNSTTASRPASKRSKRESAGGDWVEDLSGSHSLADPSNEARSTLAQSGQGALPSNTSPQSTTIRGLVATMPENHPSTVSEATPPAVPRVSERNPISHNATLPDWDLMPSQPRVSEEDHLAISGQAASSFMNEFVDESMSISPSSFPPPGQRQEATFNVNQNQDGSLEQLTNPSSHAFVPDQPPTTSQASVYPPLSPETETAPYGQEMQTRQFPTSAVPQTVQQNYPLSTGPLPTAQAQHPVLRTPSNPYADARQGLPNPLNPIDPSLLPEAYLWTQLEAAQLTLVGTLTGLVVRTQRANAVAQAAGAAGGGAGAGGNAAANELLDIETWQVRSVTTNLINIMSLWWMLRQARGWDA